MNDYLQQAKEGLAKQDWGFVLFCLTRYMNHPDSQGTGFDAVVDIMENLVRPELLSEIGQERVLDFLKKVPYQYRTNPKYLQLLNQIQSQVDFSTPISGQISGEESASASDNSILIRMKLHEGTNELIAMVDEGLAAMYSYDFDRAIVTFQQVLAIDPNYESAKEYLQDAKEYNSGKARPPRLPQEITLPLGRAMSMFRAGKFKLAQKELNSVYEKLAKHGIREWNELRDLFMEVTDGLIAEDLFAEAKDNFKKGELDKAAEKTRQAFNIIKKPIYDDYLQKIENLLHSVKQITEALNSLSVTDIDGYIQINEKIKELSIEFDINSPLLHNLRVNLETIKPSVVNSLRREIKRLIAEAEIAQTISLAHINIMEAHSRLESAESIIDDSTFLTGVSKEIYQLDTENNGFNIEISHAENLASSEGITKIKNIKVAKQIIKKLYQRFPADPRVTALLTQLGGSVDLPYSPSYNVSGAIEQAKKLFEQNHLDDAIGYLEFQYKLTSALELRVMLEEYKEIARILANLNEIIYSGNVTEIIETSKTIVALRDKYGDLPIPEPLLAKLNYQLLIYLIDSKQEENTQIATSNQNIVIQGLLGNQPSFSFHEYYRVINGMILKDPLNQRLQILLSWVKHEIDLNDKQTRNRTERNKSIESFRDQAKAWFVLSIVTAVAFLTLAIYIILLSTQQNDVWVRLSSLFSILPVFISKLVYDQSLIANRRADEMYEKLMDEDARNVELDRLDEKDIRKKVFQEKSKPRQKKTDSNKNTLAS